MVLMPLVLPVYLAFSRWWEVEPRLLRALVIGSWLVYYIPKLIIATGIGVKDLALFVIWLFGWFQKRLLPAPVLTTSRSLDLTDMKRIPRRDFLRKMGWSVASAPFVVVGYGVFRTLYDFELHRIDVPIAGLPRALQGLTIAQISDLHAGSLFSPRPMLEAISIVNGLHPDLITVTGDFVNSDAAEVPLILPALNALKASLGVYGCLGNHDHYARVAEVASAVATTPVDLLVNAHRTLDIDGARLHILGTDNTGFYQHHADLPAALEGLVTGNEESRILLAHDPTFWDTHILPDRPDIDLMLCGHTHGGQLGVELGPFRWSFASFAYPRWAGLYQEPRSDGSGPQYLYVNRGLGTVGPPLRLGIRPEVTLLTLLRA